jgi:hypothetical protein
LEMIHPLVQEQQHFVDFPRWPRGGHIWSPIGPNFGRNVDGA